jgi:nucleotide-binding universal stress UspA family protein
MSGSPVIVAYDGSVESEQAVRAAATLFGDRRLVIVSVWEPGLALAMSAPMGDLSGLASTAPDAATIAMLDRAQRDHAQTTAAAGAQRARALGATADARPVADELDIVDTIALVADEQDAAAVVVGSRGLGHVKGRLLGSTSQGLLHRTRRPVVVVRVPE